MTVHFLIIETEEGKKGESRVKRGNTGEPRRDERFTNARERAETAPAASRHNCTHTHVLYVPANIFPCPLPHTLPLRHLTISDDLVPGALPMITYVTSHFVRKIAFRHVQQVANR